MGNIVSYLNRKAWITPPDYGWGDFFGDMDELNQSKGSIVALARRNLN
ncbi:hypothetical protein [Cytobacillus luteolus]|nr:hypothetical protein [Cytobacillus luteolus]